MGQSCRVLPRKSDVMNRQSFPDASQRYPRLEQLVPAQLEQRTVLANGIRQHYARAGGAKPALVLLQAL